MLNYSEWKSSSAAISGLNWFVINGIKEFNLIRFLFWFCRTILVGSHKFNWITFMCWYFLSPTIKWWLSCLELCTLQCVCVAHTLSLWLLSLHLNCIYTNTSMPLENCTYIVYVYLAQFNWNWSLSSFMSQNELRSSYGHNIVYFRWFLFPIRYRSEMMSETFFNSENR